MAATRWRLCARCPEVVPAGSTLCPSCSAAAEAKRGTPTERGYGVEHRKVFREGVLVKHPICVVCRKRRASVADHWPMSRRDLELNGFDPDDPGHGRGLCHVCHSKETAINQPGGWNARR